MDHHVHTFRCHHATGHEEDYVKVAIQKGLPFIGFNDHFPMRYLPKTIPVEKYAMELNEFPDYITELKRLRKKYDGKIDIKISTEVDFHAPSIDTIKEWLNPFLDDFDYIYGSVHVVDDWAVDDHVFSEKWEEYDNNKVYEIYYENNIKMVKTGIFNVVGHMDLPKKYNHFPSKNIDPLISKFLDEVKKADAVVELNTAGLRKPVKEMYPSEHILK
ncbi:MAG: histidinol-phosphatase, partial [Promethearchaeota archaeon]